MQSGSSRNFPHWWLGSLALLAMLCSVSGARRTLLMACVSLALMAVSTGAQAFAISSIVSADWQTATTWSILTAPPGTITTSTVSTTVTGVGTSFTVLQAGDRLLTTANALVGTVASVTSNTVLTLGANAAVNLAGSAYRLQKVPGAADDVTISAGDAVTLNSSAPSSAKALSLTFAAAGAASSLTHAAGIPLAVGGNVIINAPATGTGTRAWKINAGSATVAGNVSLVEGNNDNRIVQINLTSGPAPNAVLDINGDLTLTATSAVRAVINMTGGTADGTINLAGTFAINTTGTLSMGAGAAIFNFDGAAAQTVPVGVSSVIYRNLHLNNTSATGATLSAAISAANVTGNVRVQSGILDNGGFAIVSGGGGGVFEVANGARFNLTGTSAMASGFTTFTFGPTSTVSFQGGAQNVATGLTYGHLILSNGSNKTPTPAGTMTVAGDFTLGVGTTYVGTGVNPAVNLAGNFTNSGTFNSGTGPYTFNGTSTTAQTLTGVTTFTNMVVNNTGTGATAGLSLASNITVGTAAAGVLTLTSGKIATGANALIVETAGTISGGGSSSYVIGNLRKNFAAGATSITFHIGDSTNYTPVAVTVAGAVLNSDMTASTTAGDHPNIATSAFHPGLTANRYWTLLSTTVPGTYGAAFTFINPGDLDSGTDPANNFEVQRFSGGTWNNTTLGTRTATSTQATGLTLVGAFAVGERTITLSGTQAFNAYDHCTSGCGVSGFITTKIAGTAFSALSPATPLDIVAVNSAGTAIETTFKGFVKTELVDATTGGGVCASMTSIQTLSPNTEFLAADAGRKQNISFTENESWPNVKVRITYPSSGVAPVTIACSADAFAIRPASLVIGAASDADWATAGAARTLNNLAFSAGNTVVHKAGQPFTLTATAANSLGNTTANYAGSPTVSVSACATAGPPAACTTAFGTLTPGTWGAASGVVTTTTATYSDVGAFGLQLQDTGFAAVDSGDGVSTPAQRNIPLSAKVDVGRFVPDHFDAATTGTAPQFLTFNSASCASRSFTYIGQPFGYVSGKLPTALVTARNASGGPTTNYQDNTKWWRIITSTDVTQTYGSVSPVGSLGTPTVTPNNNNTGTGTASPNSNDTVAYARGAPQVNFNANITLTMSVVDASEVASATNSNCPPATSGPCTISSSSSALFNGGGSGIAFDSGIDFRYGRLIMLNAHGSALLALDVPVQIEYWNGTLWLRNAADNCTSVAPSNFAIGNLVGLATTASGGGTVSNGGGSITLTKPTSGTNGTVDVTINLGATGTANANPCPAWAPAPAATAFNTPYLQSQCAGAGAYNRDPSARATFGIYRNKFILLRENY
jgi:MSHA biogenesis protein MshQ